MHGKLPLTYREAFVLFLFLFSKCSPKAREERKRQKRAMLQLGLGAYREAARKGSGVGVWFPEGANADGWFAAEVLTVDTLNYLSETLRSKDMENETVVLCEVEDRLEDLQSKGQVDVGAPVAECAPVAPATVAAAPPAAV